MVVNTRGNAILASSIDDAIRGINKGVRSKDMSIRGNHAGISVEYTKKHGAWDEAMGHFKLWSAIKPHLSEQQKIMIAGATKGPFKTDAGKGIFIATESEDHWQIRRSCAMRRKGIDADWQKVPERPEAAPRQFFKADGEALEMLHNPYVSQKPVVELNVMSAMYAANERNISLMPKNNGSGIIPDGDGRAGEYDFISDGVEQKAGFNDGKFTVEADNTKSDKDYKYFYRGRKGEKSMHWLPEAAGLPKEFDMSKSRGGGHHRSWRWQRGNASFWRRAWISSFLWSKG